MCWKNNKIIKNTAEVEDFFSKLGHKNIFASNLI